MGEAMLSSILDKGLSKPGSIFVSDISEVCCQRLGQKYGVEAVSDNLRVVERCDVVILAVKPQNLSDVMAELKGHLKTSQLVLSIIAGAKLDTISKGLNHNSVVRAMPNTPAQIGEGISVWTASADVTGQQKEQAGSILGAMGEEIFVDDEGYIDMATAVSGSGPAYVFLFMESLVDAAVKIGLPREMARKLVQQAVSGSCHFARKSDKSLAELRKMVTSPGGTTAEALLQLEKGKFSGVILQAVIAAYNKAKKLGE